MRTVAASSPVMGTEDADADAPEVVASRQLLAAGETRIVRQRSMAGRSR